MDPISVLSTVAATVQLIEFTGKLVYGTAKIYKEATGRSDTLESITAGLKQQSLALQQSLDARGNLAEKDKKMHEFCSRCQETASKLLRALHRLKKVENNTSWDSFLTALNSIWKRQEIEELKKELDEYRQHMGLFLVHSIW